MYADSDLSTVTNDGEASGVVGSSMRFLFYVDNSTNATDFHDGVREGTTDTYWNFNTMFGCAFDQYFYIYEGSNTVPYGEEPCKEIVWTYVTRKPLPITPETLAHIMENINYENNTNHRELQDIGDREVWITGKPCHADQE